MKNYIIGGGISGLIASFYNKDYKIISLDIGGQFGESINLGPRILEVNEDSSNLINDLNLKNIKIKTSKIGYKIGKDLVDSINKEDRIKYYLKSRCIENCDIVPNSIMSDGKNKIDYYDINWNEIIISLIKNGNQAIMAEIVKIDTIKKLLFIRNLYDREIKILNYDNIISTLPAPLFYKLSGIKSLEEFNYASKIFATTSKKNIDIGDYDYVYFPEKRYGFHRITKIENKLCIEYTTNKGIQANRFSYWCKNSYEINFIKIGQIISGRVEKFDNINFLGRYAEWDHSIKINNVIKKIRRDSI